MEQQSVIHDTFVIERSFPVSPERVFNAFADPVKKRRWFFESGGHKVEHFEMEFRVGGKEQARLVFTQPSPVQGMTCINDGSFQNIVPNKRIVSCYSMTIGGICISASLTTLEFLPSETGTDLIFTHQGVFFEGSDGPKMRQGGWQTLFDRLAEELAH